MIKRIKKMAKCIFSGGVVVRPPIYIFTLEGALAIEAYAQPLSRTKPDVPVMCALIAAKNFNCEVRILSEAEESQREFVVHWLSSHLGLPSSEVNGMVHMRDREEVSKSEFIERYIASMPPEDLMRVFAAYDGEPSCATWIDAKIPCFQVNRSIF